MKDIIAFSLRQIPCMADVQPHAIEKLADSAKVTKFDKGHVIISEGDTSKHLYIVIKGRVMVQTQYAEGKLCDLAILEKGAYFGEMALITKEPRAATVSAIDKTTCATIGIGTFRSWLDEHPSVNIDMLKVVTEKISYMTEKTRQMTLSSIYAKLSKNLNKMAENGIISNPPSLNELAVLTESPKDLVSEIMQELTRGKYITTKSGELRILSKLPETW